MKGGQRQGLARAAACVPRGAGPMQGRQRGVALVSILLLVAMVSVLAASLLQTQRTAIGSLRGFVERGQAEQYALGGEELARQLLHEDLAEGDGRDHLAEAWAGKALRFAFAEGEVQVEITDLQGRLNLNGLAEGQPYGAALGSWMANLLDALGLDASLLAQMQDWLDADADTRLGGAEDHDYLGLGRLYRTAGGMMADVSEVRLLLGMSAEGYQALSPYLAALPDDAAALNVNTAPPLLLQALAKSLSPAAAEALAERRDRQEGFESVAAFLQAPELAGAGLAATGLSVRSAYFSVQVVARYRDRYSYLTSIIQRSPGDGSLRLLARDFSRLLPPAAGAEEAASG